MKIYLNLKPQKTRSNLITTLLAACSDVPNITIGGNDGIARRDRVFIVTVRTAEPSVLWFEGLAQPGEGGFEPFLMFLINLTSYTPL